MYGYKGTITVFLSLISILFLSLFCTMIESARIQGARLQAAAAFDMGLFSVFGEYDRVLLEEYDVWFLDGTCGKSRFSEEVLDTKLQNYIYPNLNPSEGINVARSWKLFPTEMDVCTVEGYALATDEGGQVFYQQVLENEKELFIGNAAASVRKMTEKIKTQEKEADRYQKDEKTAEEDLKKAREEQAAEDAEKTVKEESGSSQEEGNTSGTYEGTQEWEKDKENQHPEKKANPLDTIKKLKKMGILSLVMKDPSQVSEGRLSVKNLPSKRNLRKGTLKIKQSKSSVAGEVVFLEYLKKHFQCVTDKKKNRMLACELEYIAAGKESDAENLKKVVNKLLLLREGTNYACILASPSMRGEAMSFAAVIAGSAAVPALTKALQKALMLAWAYGESLMDVRTLLAGGKVPLVKTEADWKLSLENLLKLEEVLEECDKGEGKGQTYQEYLMGILSAVKKKQRNLRTLDLIEACRRAEKGGENFRADALVVRMKAKCTFEFAPVFLTVPAVFMKLPNQGVRYQIEGSYGYMEGGG